MARRILAQEQCQKERIEIPTLGTPNKVSVLKEIAVHDSFRGVYCFQFNYSGEILAVGFGAGGVQLYESSTGKMLKEVRQCRHGGHAVMVLRFHPKFSDVLYAATTEGHILVFDDIWADKPTPTVIEESGNEIMALDFCVDGFNFATGGKDLGVRVYETKTNKLVQHYKGYDKVTSPQHQDKNSLKNTMRIYAVKFHPDNQYVFVSGGWDNHLKIWDTRANDGIKRNIAGPHICGDSLDIKGNTILAGQWRSTHALQEYDYTSGKVVKELEFPHKDGAFIYSAQYANDDLVVAGGSRTNRAELIEISSNKHCGGFDLGAPVQAIDSAKNGRVIAVGGSISKFYLLTVSE